MGDTEASKILGCSADCISCGEAVKDECSGSKRECGHHCNCSWVHDACCWCGEEFGEEDGAAIPEGGK